MKAQDRRRRRGWSRPHRWAALPITALILALLPAAFTPIAAQSVVEPIAWGDSLAAARAESAETGRPILLLVTAGIWCDPCVWLDTNVLRSPEIADRVARSFFPVRLMDTQREARAVEVTRLPTLIVLDPAGNERLRLDGAITARTLDNELRLVAERIAATAPSADIPEGERDLFDRARFRIGSGTLWNAGGGRWYSEDAGIPPQLEEFDRDEQFLYLMDGSSGDVLAISIPDGGRSLWRWDRRQETWVEEATMMRLPDAER